MIQDTNFSSSIYRFTHLLIDNNLKACFRFVAIVFLFYLLTSVNNLSETDDVYHFAYKAENFAFDQISDPRLMLYHMLMRGLYLSINSVTTLANIHVSSMAVMGTFSALCASISLLLMIKLLHKHFALSIQTSVYSTAFLAFSYGFWRYAAEVEVYLPAIMLCLLIFYKLLDTRSHSVLPIFTLGIIGGLSVLFYQPLVIPLFMAFPILLLKKSTFHLMLIYGFTGAVIILLGYLLGYYLYWPAPLSTDSFISFLSQRKDEFSVPAMSWWTVIVSIARSAFAILHDFSATNYAFAFAPLVDFIERLFPANIIVEEKFTAQHFGRLKYLLLLIHAMLGLSLLYLLRYLFTSVTKIKLSRPIVVVLLWTLVNGAIIGRLNPAGIEAWIMLFPAFMILAGIYIVNKALASQPKTVFVALVLLFSHNAMGGMYFMHSDAYEYHKVQGKWVIENGTHKDLVIVAADANLEEMLRYFSASRVTNVRKYNANDLARAIEYQSLDELDITTFGRDFNKDDIVELMTATWKNGGRVIVFDQFFENATFDVETIIALRTKSEKVYTTPNNLALSTYILPVPENVL